MYKILIITIIIILGILSTLIGVKPPKMHKEVFIYNSDYQIVTEQKQDAPITISKKEENKTAVIQNKQTPIKRSKTEKQKQIKKEPAQTKTVKKTSPQTITNEKKKEQKRTEPLTVKKQAQEIKKAEQNIKSEITETEEETIKWNKWRSDLQNQIMKDVKLPIIKEGVIFKFSFEADKYGKISNVKTWSTDAMYTPYAIQYIAPVIKSYQGKDILNFPDGSKRYSTIVEGAWKISKTLKYSTPNDFKDTEKITGNK